MSKGSLTISESEAWEAARDACVDEARRMIGSRTPVSARAALVLLIDRLRALRPSVPSDLESRG